MRHTNSPTISSPSSPSSLAATLTVASILALWLCAAWIFVPAARQKSAIAGTERAFIPPEPAEENPEARARYEQRILQNPATKRIPDGIRAKELQFASRLPNQEFNQAANQAGNRSKSRTAGSIQAAAWTQRGPYAIGGRTRAFAIDAANERVLVAGSVSGGIWRSEDAGATWRRTSSLSDLPNISSIAQDTRAGKTNVWYAATGEGWGNSATATGAPYRGDGVYKSTDGARTWSLLPSTATNTPERYDQRFDYTWTLATNPANAAQDELYAALFGCIRRSTDGGTTWRTVLGSDIITQPTTGRFTDVAVAPRSGVIYATISRADGELPTDNGIFRSTDGIRWTRIAPSGFPISTRRIVIAISPLDENQVYFVGETPGRGFEGINDDETEYHSLWRYTYLAGNGSTETSADNATWDDFSQNLPRFTGAGRQGDFVSQASYDMVMGFKPDNRDVVFLGGHNLYRSIDAFRSSFRNAWIGGYEGSGNYSVRDNHYVDQHALAFLPSNPNVMYTANDGGIFRTDNCVASNPVWTPLNNGYITTQFYGIAIAPTANTSFIVGGMQDNGSWATPNGANAGNPAPQAAWASIRGGDGGFAAVGDPQHSSGVQYVYISQQFGATYRYRTNADFAGFSGATLIKPVGGTGYDFIAPFMLDPVDSRTLYLAAGRSLWRQRDATSASTGSNGTTSAGWASWANLGRSSGAGANATTEDITAFGAAPLAGSSGGSSGGGATSRASRLYVGTSAGRVLRIDAANTVEPSASAAANQVMDVSSSQFPAGGNVICVAADQADANRAIAVFSNYEVQSLFLTENGGQTWTAIGGNLEQNPDGTGNGPSCRWASILNVSGVVKVYVGTSTGLYTTDLPRGGSGVGSSVGSGANTRWVQEGASVIGNAVVSMVCTRNSDGFVAACTHGNGVFSSTAELTQTDITGDDVVLQQNFPNPLVTTTTFRYKLPEQAVVSLAVYDLLGKQVTMLVNEAQNAGVYQRRWDGTSSDGAPIATGTYFYRLTAAHNGTRTLRTGTILVAR
jgi:hypothetical protein